MRKIICSLAVMIIPFTLYPAFCAADEFHELLSSLQSGNLRTSAASLEDFVKQHPRHAESRLHLARSYMGLNQNSLAEDQLRACMELASPGSDLQNQCINLLKEISQSKSSSLKSTVQGRSSQTAQESAGSPPAGNASTGQHSAATVQQFGTLRKTPGAAQTAGGSSTTTAASSTTTAASSCAKAGPGRSTGRAANKRNSEGIQK